MTHFLRFLLPLFHLSVLVGVSVLIFDSVPGFSLIVLFIVVVLLFYVLCSLLSGGGTGRGPCLCRLHAVLRVFPIRCSSPLSSVYFPYSVWWYWDDCCRSVAFFLFCHDVVQRLAESLEILVSPFSVECQHGLFPMNYFSSCFFSKYP